MAQIGLGMPEDSKEIFLREKLEYVLDFGEKYNLLERLNGENIRLVCPGISTGAVLKNIKDKFMRICIDEKSEELAKEVAMRKFIEKEGIVQLSRFVN